jgi:death-on-curing protein
MNDKIVYPTIDEIIELHKSMISIYGGESGDIYEGDLDFAVEAMKEAKGLFRKAATIWRGITQNHPFLDGNKRTGYVAAKAFLKVNGHDIDVDKETAFRICKAISQGKVSLNQIESWLVRNSKRKANGSKSK